MHTRQEKCLCVVCPHHRLTAEQTGEHIAHHVPALRLIEEQRECQMIHLRVVRLEQTFNLFSCHTLIIQFRRRKCKAEMRFFSILTQIYGAKLQKSYPS